MEEVLGIAIIFLIAFLILIDRKNIKREGLILIRRFNGFTKEIEKISKKYERFLNIFGNFCIVIAFILSILSLYFLINLIFVKTKEPAIQIVLPSLPGVCKNSIFLCVPPHYWIIIILIVAFSHEIMHAILSFSNKINVKSMGYAFFTIIPAFFVEPDEKIFEKSKTISKLRVLSVGSIGNILISILIIFIFFFLFFITSKFFKFYGLEVEVIPNSSAYYANLSGIILKVDGKDATVKNLREILMNKSENDSIEIETTEGVYKFNLKNRTIGIRILKEIYLPISPHFSTFYPIFDFSKNFYYCLTYGIFCNLIANSFWIWLIIINIGVGIFNLLPIKPLDGGKMWEEVLKIIFPKTYKKISDAISLAVLLLILFLLFRPLI